jgi:hypothetical protein
MWTCLEDECEVYIKAMVDVEGAEEALLRSWSLVEWSSYEAAIVRLAIIFHE